MSALLTIGEFSRATHLSVKALRHYDEFGLLQPTDVDPSSGYRRYATAQVPVAHLIRRFRDLDMPLDEIRTVLEAPDVSARDRAIIGHLERMEEKLEQTKATVASLRALLDGGEPEVRVEYRSVPGTIAIAIRDHVDWDGAESWLGAALAELDSAVAAVPGGPRDQIRRCTAPSSSSSMTVRSSPSYRSAANCPPVGAPSSSRSRRPSSS